MKRASAIILILIILLTAAGILCACNVDDIPQGVPINWQNYLRDVGEVLADEVSACDETVSVNLGGNFAIDGKSYTFSLRGNYDGNDPYNGNIAVAVNDIEGNAIFSVLSDNRDTYIEIAPNALVESVKLKLQETCLFSYFDSIKGRTDEDLKKSVADGFVAFGKVMFMNADVNADKTVYSFNINGDALGERLYNYFKAINVIDEQIGSVILGILGIKDADRLFSAFSSISGKVDFYIEDGGIAKISSGNLAVDKTDGNFELALSISDDRDGGVKELFPASDAGYKVTKVGSTSLDGALSLIASNGNKYAIRYGLSLNTNIDLMKLAVNGFDLDALDEENFFHFRLTHRCDTGCNEYCASRISESEGSVLDVAFSPKQFGTSNVYISMNIHALMSREYLDSVTKYLKTITDTSVPEYVMAVIPASNMKGEFSDFLYAAYITLMNIGVGESREIATSYLKEAFAYSELAELILSDILRSEEYDIDMMKVKVNGNIFGQAFDYDIFKETVYLIDSEVPELKKYETNSFGNDYTAYKWAYEERREAKDGANTYRLNNIYDKDGANLLHGADGSGKYVPMSDVEAQGLKGCALKLDCCGADGIYRSTFGEILDVKGLDLNNFEPQEITLKVRYPNIFDYAFEALGVAEKIMEGFWLVGKDEFAQEVKAVIKLTREAEGTFEFHSADTDKKYLPTYMSDAPELLKATVTVHYVNGSVKSINAIGRSDSVITSLGLFSGTRYSISDWGSISVRFNVAGRNISRYFYVEKPDGFEVSSREQTGQIGESCNLDGYVTVRALYGDRKITLKLTLKDFYINNVSLDADTSDWYHYTSYTNKYIVFNKSGDYTVQIKKLGVLIGQHSLHISDKRVQTPTYAFNTRTEEESVILAGSQNRITGSIVNETHGDGDGVTYTLSAKVEEYKASGGQLRYVDASADDYALSITADSVPSETNGTVNVFLPSLIINPIGVQIDYSILKAGTYRITLYMSDSASALNKKTLDTFTVSVLEDNSGV